jgi:DNA-binding transcriptional regulator GbsR (MarR family)
MKPDHGHYHEQGMEGSPMSTEAVEQRVDALRQTIVALVRRDGPDLSARQLGVFLTSYLEAEAQTVRGLAANLNVSKPAITRALDRLTEFDLVRRKTDPLDRRSIFGPAYNGRRWVPARPQKNTWRG